MKFRCKKMVRCLTLFFGELSVGEARKLLRVSGVLFLEVFEKNIFFSFLFMIGELRCQGGLVGAEGVLFFEPF